MHMHIRVVVESHDVHSAVHKAQRYFEENLHYTNGGIFDYCKPMESGHRVSGADRWTMYEDKDLAFPLDSEFGSKIVEGAWESTVEALKSNVEEVWDAIEGVEDADEFAELLLDNEGMARHTMNRFADHQSTDYYLYVDGWMAGGIRDRRGWEHVQELMDEEAERDENQWWVVPLDAHY